jgi:hypothetical protein
MVRRIVSLLWCTCCLAQPAFAHGEEAIIAIGIDGVLVVAAVVIISLALKCSIWLRLSLIATYIASAGAVLFIPGNWSCNVLLICGRWLEMAFLLALPTVACAALYAGFNGVKRLARNHAL